MQIKTYGQEVVIILTALRTYKENVRKKYGDETVEVKEITKIIEKLSNL